MQINPAIDNKRVICCNDPKMLTSTPKDTSFTTTNAAVDPAVVAANLDEMAMQLAQKTTALKLGARFSGSPRARHGRPREWL